MPYVLDQILERNLLRHVQHALDFVHRVQAANPLRIGNGNHHPALAPRRTVAFRRGMHRVQPQAVFIQRVADFAHALRFAIAEMLRSAENLHRGKSRLRDLRQQRRAKRLVYKPVSGKDALHSALGGGTLWSTENPIPSIAPERIQRELQERRKVSVNPRPVPPAAARLFRPGTAPPGSKTPRAGACASVPAAARYPAQSPARLL